MWRQLWRYCRRFAFQPRQSLRDSGIKLPVSAVFPVGWVKAHLDVRIRSVVLHTETLPVEREGETRLRDDSAVHQLEAPVDPDDPTPAAFPHHRAKAKVLSRGSDDVTIGARVGVGDKDHRSAHSLCRVGFRGVQLTSMTPPHNGAHQPFQHQG